MLSVPPALAGGILGLEVVNRTLTYQPFDIRHFDAPAPTRLW